MSDIVKRISYAMSLRAPQEEALSYLDAISTKCEYKNGNKEKIEEVASENCENQRKICSKFDFPSFSYAMATGIGKTRLMGASIYYLYKTKGYKHFFILAPGSTIYDKLRKETNPNHPKYIFKGLEAEMGKPKVYDGENYDRYPIRFEQMTMFVENTFDIQLFIFNIGKIFNSKTDTEFNFHKFKETLGASFADVLAQFDDLVICMDEAHRYYAPASMKAINYLKPILGLEFTATPKSTTNIIYAYDVARGATEGYLKIPVVMGRSNTAGYSQDDIEEMKIRDGLTLHENRKAVLREYCSNNSLDYVKPIVLIACKDTDHAKRIREKIDSDDFLKGKYKGKVIEVHSKQTGEESEENVKLLLSIESATNPIEIVLHVYKLKEGWDVNNLFTIIPLNAAKSDILAMQTIGRGLRLPFGEQTGDDKIDTLDIVAHDHYRELVDEIKNSDIFRYHDLDTQTSEHTESVDVTASASDDQLSLFDDALAAAGVKSFADISNPKTQHEIYEEYKKNFMATQRKARTEENHVDDGQMTLFDLVSEDQKEEFQIRMPDVGEYSKETLLAFEKEVLGIYVSGHPLEAYEEKWKKSISATTADFQLDEETGHTKVHDWAKEIIGGMITEKTIKHTKTNQMMAFITVEDLLGTVEVVVFPRDYEKNRDYLEVDSKVFVRGRVSEEDDKPSKMICEKIIPFERTKKELWIQFPDKATFLDEEQIVYGYLADSDGDDEVIIYCAKERAVKKLPKNRNIGINEQILSRLMNHFGEKRVKVVEKPIENIF